MGFWFDFGVLSQQGTPRTRVPPLFSHWPRVGKQHSELAYIPCVRWLLGIFGAAYWAFLAWGAESDFESEPPY